MFALVSLLEVKDCSKGWCHDHDLTNVVAMVKRLRLTRFVRLNMFTQNFFLCRVGPKFYLCLQTYSTAALHPYNPKALHQKSPTAIKPYS